MDNNDFADAVEELLNNPNLECPVALKLLCAMTLDTRRKTAVHLAELQHIIETQSNNIARITTAVEAHQRYIDQHPSFLWLMRFKTRDTLTIIFFIIMALSLWYVSGIRQPILKWFGFPIF